MTLEGNDESRSATWATAGRSPIGTSGFAISSVSGRRRVPSPAQSTMAADTRRSLIHAIMPWSREALDFGAYGLLVTELCAAGARRDLDLLLGPTAGRHEPRDAQRELDDAGVLRRRLREAFEQRLDRLLDLRAVHRMRGGD